MKVNGYLCHQKNRLLKVFVNFDFIMHFNAILYNIASTKSEKTVKSAPAAIMPAPANPEPVPVPETNIFPNANTGTVRYFKWLDYNFYLQNNKFLTDTGCDNYYN